MKTNPQKRKAWLRKDERPKAMEELDEIINDKCRQIIWKTRTSVLMKKHCSKYGKNEAVIIWSEPGVLSDQICRALMDATKSGKTHHL